MKLDPEVCLKCKGRLWCGLKRCPLLARQDAFVKVKDKIKNIKEDFSTKTNSVFIGRIGYPNINLGILTPVIEKEDIDNPRAWAASNKDIQEIIDMRSSLINSRKKQRKTEIGNDYKVISVQEMVLSNKPVSVEVLLKDKPKLNMNITPFSAPFGPNANLKKFRLEENPKIKKQVEKYYYDYDAKAQDAVQELYTRGIDENFLSKAISIGSFGLKTNRKLVPTRWSITAVDDAIGKYLIERIKDKSFTENTAYFGGHLGNYYIAMFFEGEWSFELFEMYMPKTDWNISSEIKYTTDYEGYFGRKTYAENCTGGYYAARLGVLEKLSDDNKQASVLLIRIITPEYYAPLGVWVVREAVRKAVRTNPIKFANDKLMINYAKAIMKKKFGINEFQSEKIFKESKLIDKRKHQKKITSFF